VAILYDPHERLIKEETSILSVDQTWPSRVHVKEYLLSMIDVSKQCTLGQRGESLLLDDR
jgi:hypothetical protein